MESLGSNVTYNLTIQCKHHSLLLLLLPCCQSKEFEDVGLTRKAAEQLTTHITSEIILDRIRLSEKFVPKLELEKVGSSSCCRGFWVCGSSSCCRGFWACGGCWYACSS
jgi:hypothetical protein